MSSHSTQSVAASTAASRLAHVGRSLSEEATDGAQNNDAPKPYFPLAGRGGGGWSTKERATATCYCGDVQLSFPLQAPGLVKGGNFICNCTDCRKITASTHTTAFVVVDSYLEFIRGKDKLSQYAQRETVGTGNLMTNHFCSTCGTLLFRVGEGFKGTSILRVGTVDDFSLHDTVLKPEVEQFVKDRVSWAHPAEGVKQVEGFHYA